MEEDAAAEFTEKTAAGTVRRAFKSAARLLTCAVWRVFSARKTRGSAPQERIAHSPLYLYNTLTRTNEAFRPISENIVKMYHCGPTVYGPQHIGNLSMFVFTDILRRTLEYNGYTVKQVINFTDVGHLVSDGDEGEDKMTKGLKRENMKPTLENMRALGETYAQLFLHDIALLNVNTEGTQFPRASDHIHAQIAMVQTLEEKGYAYRGERGVYFDTARFPEYGHLGDIRLADLKEGARVEGVSEKRNPTDFLLWKLDKKIGWESPWGKGFPGWHIECSAMIRSTLGEQIDIHTGGIEHIGVHHNNEIAQSECATGKRPFARIWMHRAHLQIEGAKIAKSGGAAVYLSDITERGFDPLAFRYLLLGAHYRTNASFSWKALEAAQAARAELIALASTTEQEVVAPEIRAIAEKIDAARAAREYAMSDALREQVGAMGYAVRNTSEGTSIVETVPLPDTDAQPSETWRATFQARINDDLDTPGALAVLWDMTRDRSLSPHTRRATLLDFDKILGLGLDTLTPQERN